MIVKLLTRKKAELKRRVGGLERLASIAESQDEYNEDSAHEEACDSDSENDEELTIKLAKSSSGINEMNEVMTPGK